MLALPIPLVASLMLGFLCLWSSVRRRHWLFTALLAACAVQGVVISLALHYGFELLRPLQPITASIIPPLAWLAFQGGAVRPIAARRDVLHAAAPVLVSATVVVAPDLLDLVVPGAFAGYGVAILATLRRGADALPRASLGQGELPRYVWAGIASGLLLSAVSDAAIALAVLAGQGWLLPAIVSLSTSLSLLLVGALALTQAGDPAPDGDTPDADDSGVEQAGQDAAVIAVLDTAMRDRSLYLDPDLTLERLARKVMVPAKQISAAVNRATGGNVSRFVNGYRIRHACALLSAGATVTAAMLESGFGTKSNFNREFLRLTGKSPTAWIAERRLAANQPSASSRP